MTRHAAGPWAITHFSVMMVRDSKLRPIAEVRAPGPDTTIPELLANAQLLAAAPDLLEACRAAMIYMEEYGSKGPDYTTLFRQLTSAVAKAEQGEVVP